MAIKFSQFNLRTESTATMYLVGYDGNQNIHITVDNLFGGYISGTEHYLPVFGPDGASIIDSIVSQNAGATTLNVNGYLQVTNDATFATDITVNGDSTLNGNVTLGDAPGDLITQTGTLYLNGPIKDTTDTLGAADQFLVSDASGEATWTNLSDINVGTAEQTAVYAKNTSGSTILKGTPVYITGTVGATDVVEISPADASNAATMPALGLVAADVAHNDFEYVVTGGYLTNITTDPIDSTTPSSNDTVYVKNGGGLTLDKPTGSDLIQNIAKVGKVSGGNAGSLVVSSILRTNDIPNLTQGKIWVGSTGNTIESSSITFTEATGAVQLNEYGSGIITGTATYNLSVDASGNIIETSATDNNDYVDGISFTTGTLTLTRTGALPDLSQSLDGRYALITSLATVATTGAYSDLSGTPTLATVATTGSYNDLSDKPTIPAAYTDSDVDAHLNTSTATTGQLLSWTGADYNWITSPADNNDYVNAASFNTSDGVLTLTRTDTGTVTVDLDGRYVTTSGVTSVATSAPITGGTITSTGTIGITQATTSTDGYLSSTDWNTFNNKTSNTGTVTSVALTTGTTGTDVSVSGSPITTSGTITLNIPVASGTNTGKLSSTDWTTFNNKQDAITTGNLTETTSSVLTITGGTGAVIGSGTSIAVSQATASTSGYLSSTDWNTFNNKTSNTGTVTSVAASAGTGISITGSPITTSGTLTITNTSPNVTTNLSTTYASTNVTVNSSDGTDATINAATTSLAGVMTAADKTKLDGIATGATANTGTVTSVATSAPITGGTITTSGTIGITQATTSTSGYLSSTDWNTFNGKQDAGSYVTTNTTQTISGSKTFSNTTNFTGTTNVDYGINVNDTYGIYWGESEYLVEIVADSSMPSLSIINNGNNVFHTDYTYKVGIGTTTPAQKLDVNGNIKMTETAAATDTDKFVVSDSGVLKYRTGAQVLSDIGAQASSNAVTTNTSQTISGSKTISAGTLTFDYPSGLGSNQILFKTNGVSNSRIYSDYTYDLKLQTYSTNGDIELGTTSSTKVYIDNGTSRVGINDTTPSYSLDVNGTFRVTSSASFNAYTYLTSTNSTIYFGNNKGMQWASYDIDNPAIYGSNSFDGLYVGSMSGTTGFGPVISVHTYDSQVGINTGSSSLSYDLQLANNSAAKPSSIYWTTVSDERVKTNIRPYEKGLAEVIQLQPKLYDYNGKGGFDASVVDNIGIIAQEAIAIFPEAINTYEAKLEETDTEKTELYNVDFQAMTFAMINAIKELNQKVQTLEQEINTLKNG